MDRRDFIRTTGPALAAAVLAHGALARAAAAPGTAGAGGQRVLPMNRNWRYGPRLVAGAHQPGFDHSYFERVVIPHTNLRLPWHSFDDRSYECVAIYRRRSQDSEFLEDLFTMNDFDFPFQPPNHSRYLNTEFVGHTYPTKTIDSKERLMEHTSRHACVHDQLASNPRYVGGLGWCAFDYNTHYDFGSGDRICYHGVMDIFRLPNPAAGFYRSQCDPAEEVVLEPAFHWARNDESLGIARVLICSNCEQLKIYIADKLVAEVDPDREHYPHLRYAPVTADLYDAAIAGRGELRIEGYIAGKQAIVRRFSGRGIDQKLDVLPDDSRLDVDGADSTRVVLRVADEFGAVRPFASDAIQLRLEGPAELIGDSPFALVGGAGTGLSSATRQARWRQNALRTQSSGR